MSTPTSLGYRMPAEWERHKATLLSWPKNPETFPPEILREVEKTYVTIVESLAEGEEVWLLVDDEKSEKRARSKLKAGNNVVFLQQPTSDVWVRDYAPICVKGTDVAQVKWVFNAWGDKYEDLKPDNAAGDEIAKKSGMRTFEPGIVLEGGSIDVNGQGTLLTTEQCLLNSNRNPGMGREPIEKIMKEQLGVNRVVWLGSGIVGDDTDGHIDDIARFVTPDAILVGWEGDPSDLNHDILESNMKMLREADDRDDDILDIVTVRMPVPLESPYGRLPASHLNFYIGNSSVLVPTFGSATDSDALGIIRGFFPDRRVTGIDCRALVYGLGAIHCVTQQIPAA